MTDKYPADLNAAQKFEDIVHVGNGQAAIDFVEAVGTCKLPNMLKSANWDAYVWGHGFEIVSAPDNKNDDTTRVSLTRRNFNYDKPNITTSVIPIGTTKDVPRCKDP